MIDSEFEMDNNNNIPPNEDEEEEDLVVAGLLTMEEIMSLSEEDLKEMGLSREELLELAATSCNDIGKNQEGGSIVDENEAHSEEYNDDNDDEHDYGFTSTFEEEGSLNDTVDEYELDQEELIEMDIFVDEESFKEFEQEECVETSIDDLPFMNAILEENYRLMFGEITLDEVKFEVSSVTTDQKPQRTNISKKNRLKKEQRLQQSNNVTVKMRDIPEINFIEPTQFWPHYEKLIKNRFGQLKVTSIQSIVKPYLLQRFKNAVIGEQERLKRNVSNRIVLCFHGTHPYNIPSIIEKGLLVPGKDNDLQVLNGSAYGVGIYLSVMDPSISVNYCAGGNQLFACAVLLTDTVNTKNHGSFLVIKEEAYVLPCFLVTFENHFKSPFSTVLQKEETKQRVVKTKKGEMVFSKKRKEEQREKLRLKKEQKKKL
ncbi:hypothetical protein FDP41_010754 [Naegleria fowleri]|uniref:PARP catalytic domain-containing protein n=1 Tax=Naegleria fowleri TaxID=5763 RepID=A0A6A5CBR3_NAEFO|nr:uncharacterized protein FDP41_010754 [Naegleria fowleri]KAF0982775.1 hypothetical protein FDP41_010754 [Naegleria fowleri]